MTRCVLLIRKLIKLCIIMHQKIARREAYEAEEQRFISQNSEKERFIRIGGSQCENIAVIQ